MSEPITPQQDHDRRIACPYENRGLEGIAEQLDRRLDAIERRIDTVERAVAELSRRMDSQFRWLVGMHIASLLALGSLLVSILLKLN